MGLSIICTRKRKTDMEGSMCVGSDKMPREVIESTMTRLEGGEI